MIDFEKYYRSDDWLVRCGVAEKLNCPSNILEILALDADCWVRSAVVRNPNCPLHILEILALDANYYVRWQVAENPNCPGGNQSGFYIGGLTIKSNFDILNT